jgi:hypothetical protein
MSAFDQLAAKIAAKGNVSNPRAVAAAIGRKKYGAHTMAAAARHGVSAKTAKKRGY